MLNPNGLLPCDCGARLRHGQGKICSICGCLFCSKCSKKLPNGQWACVSCHYTYMKEQIKKEGGE